MRICDGGTAVCIPAPEQVAYGLAIVFALSGFCLALLRRKTLRRLAIAALGLAVGLLWCAIYQMVFYQPAVDAAGESMQITATVQDYPKADPPMDVP